MRPCHEAAEAAFGISGGERVRRGGVHLPLSGERLARHGHPRAHGLGVAAQVEIESINEAKLKSSLTYFGFKRLVAGAFNVSLIGSTCTALPWW